MRAGNYEEAENWFEEACELNHLNASHWIDRAAAAMHLKAWSRALELLEKIATLRGYSAPLHMLCAACNKNMGNMAAAIQHSQSALELVPEHPGAIAFLREAQETMSKISMAATDQVLRGKPTDAANILLAALEVSPANIELRCKRAALLRLGGRYEDALAELQTLVKTAKSTQRDVIMRQVALAYNDRGVYLCRRRDFKAALAAFNTALEACAQLPHIFANRGGPLVLFTPIKLLLADCYRAMGDFQFALADYHQALALRPDDRHTLLRLALLHDSRGTEAYNSGAYDRALAEFTKAAECAPDIPVYRMHRADSALRADAIHGAETAMDEFRAVIALNPDHQEARTRLAQLMPVSPPSTPKFQAVPRLPPICPPRIPASSLPPPRFGSVVASPTKTLPSTPVELHPSPTPKDPMGKVALFNEAIHRIQETRLVTPPLRPAFAFSHALPRQPYAMANDIKYRKARSTSPAGALPSSSPSSTRKLQHSSSSEGSSRKRN